MWFTGTVLAVLVARFLRTLGCRLKSNWLMSSKNRSELIESVMRSFELWLGCKKLWGGCSWQRSNLSFITFVFSCLVPWISQILLQLVIPFPLVWKSKIMTNIYITIPNLFHSRHGINHTFGYNQIIQKRLSSSVRFWSNYYGAILND